MDEVTFWSGFNAAVSTFCLEASISCRSDPGKIVSSLVGDELEWCGSYSFMFLASNYTELQRRMWKAEERCKELEVAMSNEVSLCSNLRRQLKQTQLAADDNEWQFQEQMAHISNMLGLEKDTNAELRQRLSTAETKLVEVEMYLSSDRGSVSLQLEQELASCTLRIAQLEAEKDELELELRKKSAKLREQSSNITNTTTNTWASAASGTGAAGGPFKIN